MKKIVLVSMVKNEADIIESFVRHSLTYADELIVADHQSSDATWDILQKLRAEGLPLTLHRLYRVELAHREVMNRLTREAITEHGAELVLPFDADEFLVNDENNLSCRQVLETLDPENLYCLRWRVYEPLLPDQD
ncbi:MAG: glycosyltransferase family 2 protein, partial [Selenomonas sp.]